MARSATVIRINRSLIRVVRLGRCRGQESQRFWNIGRWNIGRWVGRFAVERQIVFAIVLMQVGIGILLFAVNFAQQFTDNRGVYRVSIRRAILDCRKPAEFCSPRRERCFSGSSPMTLTKTLASRISGVTSTPMTVTSLTRGSRISVRIADATTSRIASAAFNIRRLVTVGLGGKWNQNITVGKISPTFERLLRFGKLPAHHPV